MCCREYDREWKRKHIDSVRKADRVYHRKARADGTINKTEEYRIYRENNPEKVKAQQQLNTAVRAGKIKKSPCQVCGGDIVHAHHSEYSMPYSIIWLCPVHHKAIH